MKGLPTVTYGNLPVYLGVVFALINGAMVGLGGGSWLVACPVAVASLAGGYMGARVCFRLFGSGKERSS